MRIIHRPPLESEDLRSRGLDPRAGIMRPWLPSEEQQYPSNDSNRSNTIYFHEAAELVNQLLDTLSKWQLMKNERERRMGLTLSFFYKSCQYAAASLLNSKLVTICQAMISVHEKLDLFLTNEEPLTENTLGHIQYQQLSEQLRELEDTAWDTIHRIGRHVRSYPHRRKAADFFELQEIPMKFNGEFVQVDSDSLLFLHGLTKHAPKGIVKTPAEPDLCD